YCTRCWADEVGADARTLHRVSVLMGTDEARLAGDEAKADGACKVHDAKGARLAGRKGPRSVRSLRKPHSWRESAMSPDKGVGPEGVLALQFLDRRQGEWYCTTCWATAVGIDDARILERLAEQMATLEAVTAG